MKKDTLKIIVTSLITVIFLVNCSSNSSEFEQSQTELKNIAHNIDSSLRPLQNEIIELRDSIKALYLPSRIEKNLTKADTENYVFSESGMFYTKNYENRSAAIVTGHTPITQQVKRIVYFTEPMEDYFKEIVENNPAVVQVYYNSRDSYNRIYPGVDLISQVHSGQDVTQYNFYELADKNHNPDKGIVWIKEPYVDPAGRGWMISLVAPVYVDGQLEGVPGIDITITDVVDDYIEKSQNDYLILSPKGILIYAKENLANLFSMPGFKNHKYIEIIRSDTYRSEDYNILKSKDPQVRRLGQKIYDQNKNVYNFQKYNNKYKVFTSKVKLTDWIILTVVKDNG